LIRAGKTEGGAAQPAYAKVTRHVFCNSVQEKTAKRKKAEASTRLVEGRKSLKRKRKGERKRGGGPAETG